MAEIRIGIVGFGAWGPNHLRNMRAQEGVQVTMVADLSQDRLAACRKMFPNVATTDDLDKLLASPDIDAVVVATPLVTHYEIIKKALNAGKHVLAEKPLTRTGDEAMEVTKLAEEKGLTLMVGHVFMFNPGILFLKAEIDKGELGRVYYIDTVRTNLGPIRQDVGAIYDLASHDISICNFLLGSQPIEVSATGAHFLQEGKVEDVGFVTLVYPNNVVCNLHASWLDPRKVRNLTVVGDKKMATWDDMNTSEPVRIYDKGVQNERKYRDFGEFHLILRDGNIMIPKVRMFEPLAAQDAHFINALRERTPVQSDGRTGVAVVRVLEAALESIKRRGQLTPVVHD
ncbi:MAG: Gfo/Idh/MocA family oxidoreductase [Polyangiaceae bacterium]